MTTPIVTTFSADTRRFSKVFPKGVVHYFSHVCGRIIWSSKKAQFMIIPYSNPLVTCGVIRSPVVMLFSRSNIQHLEPQASWRRRRVIVFGPARSISLYFAIFREKQSFPTRERSSSRTRPKGWLPLKRQPTPYLGLKGVVCLSKCSLPFQVFVIYGKSVVINKVMNPVPTLFG